MVTGTSSDTFAPDGTITREQIAAMLWRYAKAVGKDVSAPGELTAFPDGAGVAAWAADGMAWAVGAKLINGTGNGLLAPQDTATRSQVAQILRNFGG